MWLKFSFCIILMPPWRNLHTDPCLNAMWWQTSGKCCHQRWWSCSSETNTFKEILFNTDRGQKGTQLLDPEDLQGYLAYQAYQVMEKLDLLAHLDHLDHQGPLQYMAQVSFSVCMQVQPRAHNSHMTNAFISGRLSYPLCIPEPGCSPLSSCPPPVSPRGGVGTESTKGAISLQRVFTD